MSTTARRSSARRPENSSPAGNTSGGGGVSKAMTVPMITSASARDVLAELRWLRGLAQRLAAPGDADDLVQDTWIAAWRAAPPVDGTRPLRSWLARVLRNRASNLSRGRQRRNARETLAVEGEPGTAATADAHLRRVRLLEALMSSLDTLPELDQRIITLRYAEDRNATEIAHALGLEPATVRSRVKRALERLRVQLDERYGGRAAWAGIAAGWSAPELGAVASVASTGAIPIATIALLTFGAGVTSWWALPKSGAETAAIEALASVVVPAASEPGPHAPSTAPDVRARWNEMRTAITTAHDQGGAEEPPRATEATEAHDVEALLTRMSHEQNEIFAACVADLGLLAGEVVEIESEILGAPEIGTIVADVRVRGEIRGRAELLECLTQGMYTVRGPAPQRAISSQMSLAWGPSFDPGGGAPEVPALPEATPLDPEQARAVERRQLELQDSLRPCAKEHPDADGSASLRVTLGEHGRVTAARFAETTLDLDAVDCMAEAMIEHWTFESLPAGTVLALDQAAVSLDVVER